MVQGFTLMRKTVITLLKFMITAIILGVIIHRFGWQSIKETLAAARVDYLLLAAVVFGISNLLGAVQWVILLRSRGLAVPFGLACKVYFIGTFFNNFVFGTVASDAVRVSYVKMASFKGRTTLAATFLDRFVGLWAMMGFALVGSLILLRRGMEEGKDLTTAYLALAGTLSILAGVTAFLVSSRLQRWACFILSKMPLPRREVLQDVIHSVRLQPQDTPVLLKVFSLALAIQFLRVAVHILCGAALGLLTALNYQYFFIFVPVLAILMVVPLPFGAVQSVGGSLFALAGFEVEAAFVMEFLAALVGVFVSGLGGIVFLLDRGRNRPT
jgi:uncharacterized membrane protein YbhN (UPF0104 family)